MTIAVRAATADDLAAVATLLEELHDPPDSVADEEVWGAMLSQPNRTILIAELDGTPAGTADMWVMANLTYGARPRANVENVAVASSCRRRGVGTALMREVERRATEAGCYKVQLMSADFRVDAHAFYEHLGYDRVAEGFRHYL